MQCREGKRACLARMERAMKRHRCPPWCHKCPRMDGEIMPGCMGTAAMGYHRCTCTQDKARRAVWRRVAELEAKVAALQAKVG